MYDTQKVLHWTFNHYYRDIFLFCHGQCFGNFTCSATLFNLFKVLMKLVLVPRLFRWGRGSEQWRELHPRSDELQNQRSLSTTTHCSHLQDQPETQNSHCGSGHLQIVACLQRKRQALWSFCDARPSANFGESTRELLNGRSSWNGLKTISRKEHSILCYQRHLEEHSGKETRRSILGSHSLLATQSR